MDNPLYKLINALGIRHIGEKGAKILAKRYKSLENLSNATCEELTGIDEIGEIIARSITDFFAQPQNVEFIEKLRSAGVKTEDTDEEEENNLFEGKIFVLTGTLPTYTRDEAAEIIEKLGGKTSSSVSKKTSFVLAGEKAGSKLDKANALGVTVIDEEEFKRMIKTEE